jgi:hypothetical protein
MKIESIDVKFKSETFRLNTVWGLLLEYNSIGRGYRVNLYISEKVNKAFCQTKNPYKLCHKENKSMQMQSNIVFAKRLAKICTYLCSKSFIFVRLLSFLRIPVFNTTYEATVFYRKLFPGKQQDLCLPRTMFAAITSKTFKENGVIFIGVFLPSRNMHAWLIEDGVQPDPYDTMWINYQPVAILY